MPETPTADHRDRSLGLAVFGIIEILIGIGCSLLVPMTLLTLRFSPSIGLSAAVSSILLNLVMAVAFIGLGIGSIRARRWARELSLSVAWIWLITGALTVALLWIAAPALWGDFAVSSGVSPEIAAVTSVVINLLLVAGGVIVPGSMVLFFRSPHVAATCRSRDPNPGWTGDRPQRLLSLALAWVLLGVSMVAVPSYGFVFPLFGLLLSGAVGAVCWALTCGLCFVLARGTLRAEAWAWWIAVGFSAAAAVSSALTFAVVDSETVLAAMQLAPEQLLVMEALWPRNPRINVVFWLFVWGSLVGYLVVVRRLFGVGADSR